MDRTEKMRTLTKLMATAVIVSLSGTLVVATAQMGDRIIIGSKEGWIETNPLEAFFEVHPDARPESEVMSTGLNRGYLASWEILEGQLLLTDVVVLRWKSQSKMPGTEFYSVMSEVFPGQPRVIARWFTGYLVCPSGKLVEYVHLGYASTYERYKILTVVDGVVKAERQMTETQFRSFRKAQFRAWQKTQEYAKAFANAHDKGEDTAETESSLFKNNGARFMSIIFENSSDR